MIRALIEIDRERITSSQLDDVPELAELYIPCPICHGTTDTDEHGNIFCCSCGQTWSISGKPFRKMQAILHAKCPTTKDLTLT